MPRAAKKASPPTADIAPVPENTKSRRGKRPAESPVPEDTPTVPSKRTALGKAKQAAVNGVASAPVQSATTTGRTAKKAKVVKAVSGDVAKTVKDGTSEGAKLYCYGTNDCGQLGFECEKRKFPAVTPSLEKNKITAVAAGGMHTIALENNGTVWSFGLNDDKALGRHTAEEEDAFEPGKMDLSEPAIQISAGDSHSAALTSDGKVFACGTFKDTNGNFGLRPDDGEMCRQKPENITDHLDCEISKISSGGHHIAMLGKDGQLITCGTGDQGQLGRKEPVVTRVTRSMTQNGGPVSKKEFLLLPTPVKIRGNPKFCDVWTGEFSTFGKTEKNEIYVCGLNNYGQLGIKVKEDNMKNVIQVPTKTNAFKGKVWKQIAAGQHHTVALDDEGKVYTLGRNNDGRLGLGVDSNDVAYFAEPQLVPGLANKTCVQVGAGASTSYAISDEGQLYAWGFGENYQLASGDDVADKFVPTVCKGAVKRDDIDGRVLCVDAGGQHVALTISQPEAMQIDD